LLVNSPTYQRLYALQFMDSQDAQEAGPHPDAQYLPFDERAALAAGSQE
jgi:hypothetical protein